MAMQPIYISFVFEQIAAASRRLRNLPPRDLNSPPQSRRTRGRVQNADPCPSTSRTTDDQVCQSISHFKMLKNILKPTTEMEIHIRIVQYTVYIFGNERYPYA
jgi:hypothetical protein